MISTSQTILLIEDNEADRVLISAMLAERPRALSSVECCSSLADGLRFLQDSSNAARLEAVLLDLNLLDSTGLETFTAVRQAAPGLPIVVLTGNDDEATALAAVQSGAQDYLFKNALSGDLLRKALTYAVERKRLEREWRDELEQRVRERTAELSSANAVLQREIAERKRVEEALHESRRFVERITNATPSIVYILDVVSRRVLYVNTQLGTVLGYATDDFRSLDDDALQRLIHADDRERFAQHDRETLVLHDDDVAVVEVRFRHTDGSWRWLHCRKIVFRRDPNGTVRMLLGAAYDVTDRKMAEEAARQRQEQLVYVSRLTMLGELASGLTHELNQPLMAAANYSQTVLRRLRSESWSRDELGACQEKAVQQVLLAGEIIKRLRRLVSKRPPLAHETDVNETVRDVSDMIRPEAEGREVRVRLLLHDALPRVSADRVQLQQVLLNLFRNGFDAMLDTPLEHRCLTVESARSEDSGVAISVSDQGLGCDARQLDQMFEPFFTTKSQGLGMGLSISRSIIESHGGRLTAHPNLTRGLTFRFTLPLPAGVAG